MLVIEGLKKKKKSAGERRRKETWVKISYSSVKKEFFAGSNSQESCSQRPRLGLTQSMTLECSRSIDVNDRCHENGETALMLKSMN